MRQVIKDCLHFDYILAEIRSEFPLAVTWKCDNVKENYLREHPLLWILEKT